LGRGVSSTTGVGPTYGFGGAGISLGLPEQARTENAMATTIAPRRIAFGRGMGVSMRQPA